MLPEDVANADPQSFPQQLCAITPLWAANVLGGFRSSGPGFVSGLCRLYDSRHKGRPVGVCSHCTVLRTSLFIAITVNSFRDLIISKLYFKSEKTLQLKIYLQRSCTTYRLRLSRLFQRIPTDQLLQTYSQTALFELFSNFVTHTSFIKSIGCDRNIEVDVIFIREIGFVAYLLTARLTFVISPLGFLLNILGTTPSPAWLRQWKSSTSKTTLRQQKTAISLCCC